MSKEYRQSVQRQLVPFVIIGVGCAIIDFGITYSLTELTPLTRGLSKAIGWVFGTIVAYLLNSRFAFQAQINVKKAGAVFALYAVTFGVQWFLYQITDAPLQSLGLVNPFKDTVSFIIAQGVATVTNFVLQRRVIFREETKVVLEQEIDPLPPTGGDGNPPSPRAAQG
ncbi:GtrA family protein [Corynebacterium timonense]|uniref:Putative flippase GtrA (Transmembrane translocase of bactoprenol-linked glucose) n=1 Tax=Corynebacterium timonense TaxID=441500 RepID=A0A1H1TTV8_9CORY|nr:GtrA family protein [Corynebacterium timonense]SDS63594.1 Putative flippase GtrA (transmembrane translocase of bactoprenol-linked glucose) [Corynebacterium timonense]